MILQPDLMVRDVLREAFVAYRGEAVDAVRDCFAGRPEVEVNDLITYLTGRAPISVKLGYPRAAAELPGLYILLGSSREQYQVIGSALLPDVKIDDLRVLETRGSLMSTTIHAMCWTADNADLTVALQSLAQYALLSARSHLLDEGLEEQALSISDFEPLPQWFPDFAFRRDVALTGTHEASVTAPWSLIKHITLRARSEHAPDELPTTVTIP
jgi:hypothetical protein